MNNHELTLGVKLPQAWVNQLEILAQATGCSTSQLLQEAIAQYLGVAEPQTNTTLIQLSSELEMVKAELANLTQKVNLLSSLGLRLAIIEQAIASTPSLKESQFLEDDNEYEDEPDEVLSDFLKG